MPNNRRRSENMEQPLNQKQKDLVEKSVKLTVEKYGDTLRRLASDDNLAPTDDMSVEQILESFGVGIVRLAQSDPILATEGKVNHLKAEALAAIEAHYAAIRKADMEYVIGEDDGTYQRYLTVSKRLSIKDNQNQARTIKALLNIERRNQRQRMAERLNNTEEV